MNESLLLLFQLVLIFAPLSLVSVGGALAILPEVHRQSVQVQGWLTDAEFAELFAIAQAVPGPNILVVSLIGWKVAGLVGALVALGAICGPSSLLTFGLAHAIERYQQLTWLRALQAGLAPIAVGLVLASGAILTGAAATSLPAALAVAVSALLLLRTKLHPLLLMAIAAGLAVAGWL